MIRVALPLSVVVCTLNRVSSLRRCIDALLSVQTNNEWELVIVDNGSDDGTVEFLNSLIRSKAALNLTVRIALQPKRGVSIAKNTGWKSASGEIIAFTDDDCYVATNYVDNIISIFSSKPDLGFIGGRILLYDPSDLHVTVQELDTSLQVPQHTYVPLGLIQGANMAFRRKTLEQIRGFDENLGPGTVFKACEDIDAVASAVWAGIWGEYNPGPTVYHHHGRKSERERQLLLAGYAHGSGAYHAKYILRRNSRSLYMKAWKEKIYWDLRGAIGAARRGRIPPMSDLAYEIYGGLRYGRQHLTLALSPHRHRQISPESQSSDGISRW
jgi:glycosyltransferase involved in cell wall biosynthesis